MRGNTWLITDSHLKRKWRQPSPLLTLTLLWLVVLLPSNYDKCLSHREDGTGDLVCLDPLFRRKLVKNDYRSAEVERIRREEKKKWMLSLRTSEWQPLGVLRNKYTQWDKLPTTVKGWDCSTVNAIIVQQINYFCKLRHAFCLFVAHYSK